MDAARRDQQHQLHAQRNGRRLAGAGGLAVLLGAGLLALGPSAVGAPPTCHGLPATLVGTDGPDVLRGTGGPDVIVALGGNDRVYAGAGDDVVCGGYGADVLTGGPGDDRLYGQRDWLSLDRGGTSLVGDTLLGGAGDDLLDGGLDPREPTEAVLRDTVSYARAARPVSVDLSRGTASGPDQGTDVIVASPQLTVEGSDHDDTLLGSDAADFLRGGAGDDVVDGAGGDDTLTGDPDGSVAPAHDADRVRGGPGNDELDSSTGRDGLYGGPGRDTILADSPVPARVYGSSGDDSVRQRVTRAPGFVSDGGTGRNEIDVSALFGRSRPTVTVDLRRGTAGADVTPGTTGTMRRYTDVHLVDDVRWRYFGTAASERLEVNFGGPLQARTYGGDDTVYGSLTGGDRIDAGAGDDTVYADGTCTNVEHGTCR